MPSGYEAAGAGEIPSIHVFGCDLPQLNNCSGAETPIVGSGQAPSPAVRFPELASKPGLDRAETNKQSTAPVGSSDTASGSLALHRIAEIRKQQSVSERTLARRMNVDLKRYREMESPNCDLKLSELHAFQEALEVPIIDLLEDRNALSRPVEERAKLVKVMKTAVALREAKVNPRVDRMAEMLCQQLIDLMPELAEVSGWPQFGARRGASAIGKALQHPIDMSKIGLSE